MLNELSYGGVKMPDVRVVHGSNMILLTDWHIEGILPDGRVLYLDVKAGFRFDGASIPRILWRVCGHPLEAPRIAAALAHDWIYASKMVSRADADLIYRTICAWVGISAFCRNEIWRAQAVRMGGVERAHRRGSDFRSCAWCAGA